MKVNGLLLRLHVDLVLILIIVGVYHTDQENSITVFNHEGVFFSILVILSYQNACYGCKKMQKIEPDLNFLGQTKVLEAVC